jgi:Carboxylesterase family
VYKLHSECITEQTGFVRFTDETIYGCTGLFHRVISQSGVATAPYSVHNPSDGAVNFTKYVLDVGHLFECNCCVNVDDSLIDCLRKVPWNKIIEERHKVFS